VLRSRKQGVDHLWSKEEWDFVNIVFTGTDRLQHYFWHSITESDDDFHQSAMDFYHELDAIISGILERVDDECLVILLSDHGFTEIEREVNLNAWLRQEGYLKFQSEDPENLQDIHPDTTAFALDPGRIYLNLSDRYRHGTVNSADAASLMQDLKSGLESGISIRDRDGNTMNPVANVFQPDEIYHGRSISSAPDLIVQPVSGIDLKGSVKIRDIFRSERLTGCHTFENASLIVKNAADDFPFDAIQSIQDIIPAIRPMYGM
jgi:predicted AlkP superfamily phosphohydrolase/phosphomutase